MFHRFMVIAILAGIFALGCNKDNSTEPMMTLKTLDPDTAPKASVDRFSNMAGTLFIRSASNGLPAANTPIDFDQAPFITKGLGPNGEIIQYYNFDVQPTTPAPIYVLFKDGESMPVADQLNIIDVIPGDQGYNDFWQVVKVTVPSNYVANTVTSYQQIVDKKYTTQVTNMLVNCPVVPEGSTAMLRGGGESNQLSRGWYKSTVVKYFNFLEKSLTTIGNGLVPVSPIYVTFNINPDPNNPSSGPPSGFVTETGSDQTHNVAATLPSDAAYSPLWLVNVYDNADFDMVSNLSSAQGVNILATGVATPNCPIVSIQ
jgi:hypothetical protein